MITLVAPSAQPEAAYLPEWPANAKVGYVVTPLGGEGRRVRVAVTEDGCLEIEGVGTYAIVETVPVAERRSGLAALHAGRI